MTTPEFDDIDFDDDDTDPTPEPDNTPKALRRAAAEGRQAKAKATQLERENIMLKAGIDTDTPLGAMFAAGYSGELTKDAVKAAFSALGVAAPSADADPDPDPTVDPDPDISDAERNSTAQRQALASGANLTPSDPTDVHPHERMRQAHETVLAAGGRGEDAMAAGIAQLLAAGAAGDKRVLIENPVR